MTYKDAISLSKAFATPRVGNRLCLQSVSDHVAEFHAVRMKQQRQAREHLISEIERLLFTPVQLAT